MKKVITISIIAISIFLVSVFAIYNLFETKVKSQILPQVKTLIKEQTGFNVDFSEFHFSFRQLLKLEPAIRVSDLKIENAVLVEKVYLELYLKSLLNKKFEIKEIVIDRATINLEEKSNKEIGLMGISNQQSNPIKSSSTIKTKNQEAQKLISSFALNKLIVEDSIVNFYPYRKNKPLSLTDLDLKLSDFIISEKDEIESELELKALILNSKKSYIHSKGHLGPIPMNFKSIPISGNQTVKIHLEDIPKEIIEANFGSLIQRESDSELIAHLSIKGDLIKNLYGSGNLDLNNFILGSNKKHTLTANSTVPLYFNQRSSNLKLESKGAELTIKSKDSNKGKLKLDTYISTSLTSGYSKGSLHGELTGLELKETLETFATNQDLISGIFELRNFHLYFQGNNASQIEKSLKASTDLEVKNGSVKLLKKLKDYKNLTRIFVSNGSKLVEEIDDQFLDIKTKVSLQDKNLYAKNIDMDITHQVKLTGQGEVRKGQWLVFDTFLDLPKLAPIPVKIRGSVDKPTIYPDLKAVTQKQTQKVVNSFLEYGLNILQEKSETQTSTEAVTETTEAATKTQTEQSLGGLFKGILQESLKEGLLEPTSPAE